MTILGVLKAFVGLLVVSSVLASIRIPHWFFELFTHFRLQYLWSGFFLIILAAYLKDFWSMGAIALISVLNGWFVLAWHQHVEQPPRSDVTLKILHANVLARNVEHDALVKLVKEADPDVIFLQEVTPQWKSGIAELSSDWPYTYFADRPGNFGIAALSKEPFVRIHHVDSPPFNHPTIVAAIAVGNERVNLISTHPTIPLGAKLAAARNQQIESVAEIARSLPGKTIVSGDFNATNWDWRLLDFEAASGLRNARRGIGVVPTWPSWYPLFGIPIDHVFVSSDIYVIGIQSLELDGSDHLPLVVTLTL